MFSLLPLYNTFLMTPWTLTNHITIFINQVNRNLNIYKLTLYYLSLKALSAKTRPEPTGWTLSRHCSKNDLEKKIRNLISILYSAFKTHVITCSDLGIYLLSLKTIKRIFLRCKSRKLVCMLCAISILKMHNRNNNVSSF